MWSEIFVIYVIFALKSLILWIVSAKYTNLFIYEPWISGETFVKTVFIIQK